MLNQENRILVLSPEEYLKRYESDPDSFESLYIIPPELGKPGYGMIVVMLDTPELSTVALNKNVLNSKLITESR